MDSEFPLAALKNLSNGGLTLDDAQEGTPTHSMDSVSLQLKSLANPSVPLQKPVFYDFRYDDEDTVYNEIEEFYSYAEVPQVAENIKAWQGSFPGEWTTAPYEARKAHIQLLLESLEHRNAEKRFTNARRLLYLLQGNCVETTSAEHQLYWMTENCKIVRADGVGSVVDALLIASSKHDMLSNLGEAELRNLNISANDKSDFIEEINTEISVYIALLYHLIEVFKGDKDFGNELMSLEPPLPITLFNLVAALKEKSAKGYPVKKLLITLWKTLLACLGGVRELYRAKHLSRELAGLSADDDNAMCKSTPMDLQLFHQEVAAKYPTFSVAHRHEVPAERFATALAPIPVRPHYHWSPPEDEYPQRFDTRMGFGPPGSSAPYVVTPAPSPPPLPPAQMPGGKPKKQQYQTDQSKPFVFPFSRHSRQIVPYAIEEADKLYAKHIHVGLAVYQMWRTREDYIRDDAGMSPLPESEVEEVPAMEADDSELGWDTESQRKTFRDILKIENALRDVEDKLKRLEVGDPAQRGLREQREDLLRLQRVETIYAGILPVMQSSVVVLLKLLLATVTASTPNSMANQGSQGPSGNEEAASPMSLDEIDITRHREITSKAVSAILLLSLKWFKVSSVMKFHHLGQLLLDSNCLLLVLKMFGLQEVSTTVASKHDSPQHNFFRYCQDNHARNAHHQRPEDSMLSAPRIPKRELPQTNGVPDGDVEFISDYSWRNFFTSINFVKIMQKLSKHRSHRIWLLVQYKSSAILKRILKVSHPMLQLHVLKIIKSQVPFCGRKWRQSNMKVITSIYLNCRPELRDEWLTGSEVDDVSDALAQEQALRSLVRFYNTKRYLMSPTQPPPSAPPAHRRTMSQAGVPNLESLSTGPELAHILRSGPPSTDVDVFPPMRSRASDPSIFLPYIPEDSAFEEEYEDYLSDLSDDGYQDGLGSPRSPRSPASEDEEKSPQKASAWQQLSTGALNVGDGISDSESVVSIGELANDDRAAPIADENVNQWEHLSPKTLQALPKSPGGHPRRSSSGGTSLRPVLPFGLDDGSAVDVEEDEGPELGPIQTGRTAPFAAQEGGKGVDEVEYMYGE